MQECLLLGLLSLCTVEDLKKKELTLTHILVFGIGGMVLHIIQPNCSIVSVLCGMAIGLLMIGISILTRGNVGLGDGILLLVTGIYLGGYDNLQLLLTGLFFAACWSLGLLLFRKKKRNEQIAFVPFLLAAYVTMLVWQ